MKKLVVAFLLIVVAGGLIYIFSNKPSLSPSVSDSTTPTPLMENVLIVDQDEVDNLKQGGSSYSDPAGVFTFLYPNDYKQDVQNSGKMVRVYKQGPTQTGQTEMYDGVIVHFESVETNGKDLSVWVDDKIKESTSDGTSQVTSPKSSITIGSYKGFEYTLRGLGESKNYVIQKDSSSPYAIIVTTLVADPTNVGFQKQVDAILATIQLVK